MQFLLDQGSYSLRRGILAAMIGCTNSLRGLTTLDDREWQDRWGPASLPGKQVLRITLRKDFLMTKISPIQKHPITPVPDEEDEFVKRCNYS